jgi:hypothetical protein
VLSVYVMHVTWVDYYVGGCAGRGKARVGGDIAKCLCLQSSRRDVFNVFSFQSCQMFSIILLGWDAQVGGRPRWMEILHFSLSGRMLTGTPLHTAITGPGPRWVCVRVCVAGVRFGQVQCWSNCRAYLHITCMSTVNCSI